MKPDLNDAPDWIQRNKSKKAERLFIWLASTLIVIGAMKWTTENLLIKRVEKIAESSAGDVVEHQTQESMFRQPIAEIYRAEPEEKDWDEIVNEVASKDKTQEVPKSEKQNVFNDRNYQPKRNVNVISYAPAPQVKNSELKAKPSNDVKVVVVGKADPRTSNFCPGDEGSIENRDCRARWNLYERNR